MDKHAYPSDVFPESGCRLPPVERDGLDAVGKEIYDAHVEPGGGSIAGLRGPGGIKLHSPRVSEYSRELTKYFRRSETFEGAVRETAILVTARECESQFEWTAHEPLARDEGVSQATVDAIKYRRDLAGLPEVDAAIVQLGREMFADRRVTPATYARALALFGPKSLVDLVSLMADYAGTAALLCAFDMQIPPDRETPLPEG